MAGGLLCPFFFAFFSMVVICYEAEVVFMIQSWHQRKVNAAIDLVVEAKDGPLNIRQIFVHSSGTMTGNMTVTLESGGVDYAFDSESMSGTNGYVRFASAILMERGDKLKLAFANTNQTIDVLVRGQDRPGVDFGN